MRENPQGFSWQSIKSFNFTESLESTKSLEFKESFKYRFGYKSPRKDKKASLIKILR